MAVRHPAPPFQELTIYPTARWIRATKDDATIVDTRRGLLVWEPGRKVPVYALPVDDVTIDGGRTLDDPDLAGYVVLPWEAAEHWYEEDKEIVIHVHDPFSRIETLRSSRHVRVERDGHVLAESDAPILLFETGLPTRYYLPPADVDSSLLEESDHRTGCPYKGFASYWNVVLDGQRHPNLFWFYPDPFPEVAEIAGYVAPYNERVDLIVDGELEERPAGPLRAVTRRDA
jgi:uncharacterized protein (DUF427 family)